WRWPGSASPATATRRCGWPWATAGSPSPASRCWPTPCWLPPPPPRRCGRWYCCWSPRPAARCCSSATSGNANCCRSGWYWSTPWLPSPASCSSSSPSCNSVRAPRQEAAGFECQRSGAGKAMPLADDSKRSGGGQGHRLSRESAHPKPEAPKPELQVEQQREVRDEVPVGKPAGLVPAARPQHRRRMHRRERPRAVGEFLPRAPLPRHPERRPQHVARRDRTQADHHRRPDPRQLALEPQPARTLLRRIRALVQPRLAAALELEVLDRVGHVQAGAVDPVFCQRPVEQLARRPDERMPAQVLLVARLFAHHEHARVVGTLAEHGLRRRLPQRAALATARGIAERVEALVARLRRATFGDRPPRWPLPGRHPPHARRPRVQATWRRATP